MLIWASILLSFLTSFAGSMLAFVLWVHYDLDDHWEQRKHERIVRRERPKDPGSKFDPALDHWWEPKYDTEPLPLTEAEIQTEIEGDETWLT